MITVHCTNACHNHGLPCGCRSTSGICLMPLNPTKVEAKADKLTDLACQNQRDEVEAAHTAFKILHAAYLRERKEVYEGILSNLKMRNKDV